MCPVMVATTVIVFVWAVVVVLEDDGCRTDVNVDVDLLPCVGLDACRDCPKTECLCYCGWSLACVAYA